jgi:hypothetical protein
LKEIHANGHVVVIGSTPTLSSASIGYPVPATYTEIGKTTRDGRIVIILAVLAGRVEIGADDGSTIGGSFNTTYPTVKKQAGAIALKPLNPCWELNQQK